MENKKKNILTVAILIIQNHWILVALNTIIMGFLVALITHSIDLFVALKMNFKCEFGDL